MKLSVNIFSTLDGVVQGPGAPEEDPSGGFERGGWLVPYGDEDFGRIVDGWFQKTEAFLLGRTTYQLMQGYWPQVTDPDNPVATKLNTYPKYVVSETFSDDDASWANSTVVRGDVLEHIRKLKEQPGEGELQVHGSWQLANSLHEAGLVDIYRLLVFPVVVGPGKRLFAPEGRASAFQTVSSETTAAGCTHLVLEPRPFVSGAYVVEEDGTEGTR
jgi:dihydrofolate reductase